MNDLGVHAGRAQLRELSLFSGAGGGLLASQWIKKWHTVCYVEWDKYCQRVIQARIRDGLLRNAPIWDDVQTFDGRPWRGLVDIISAGFPCQGFSAANKTNDVGGSSSKNMWPSTIRIIREVRPTFVFLENVPRILSVDPSAKEPVSYAGIVFGQLAEIGYVGRWGCLSASTFGANHVRERWWCIAANTDGFRCEERSQCYECTENPTERIFPSIERVDYGNIWSESITDILRMDDGDANRVDRHRACGNGQVPIVAAQAWDRLLS